MGLYGLYSYELEFDVFDRYHTQLGVPANVTVVVREISHDAVANAGSIRIAGISDEDFVRIWDYRVSEPQNGRISLDSQT